MSATTATATALTAEQVSTILTKPLEAASQFLAAGPRIFDTTGPLRVPAAPPSQSSTYVFTGEAAAIPEVSPDLTAEVSLLPSTMKSVKVITRYSNELARQSVVSLDAVMKDRLVTDVAAKLDAQFFGDGGDGTTTPAGMFKWADTSNVDATGTTFGLDTILDAQGVALGANVPVDRLRLFLRPEDYMTLRAQKVSTTDSRYVLQPDAQLGTVPTILGLPVTITPRIPEGSAAVADMSQVAVARDLAPSVTVLTERYADTDEQGIRVVARYDVAPLNPAAVVTITGIGA